jgi:hypothetical protein
MLRKLTVALGAPLLALTSVAVGACAKEAKLEAVDPIAAVQAVPDATDDAGSGRFEMTVAIESPDGTFDITATGGFAGHRMAMAMDLGDALTGLLGGAGGGSLPAGFDEPMQVVVDGTTAYVRLPMLEGLLGTSGWLAATPEDLDTVGALGFGAGTSDPSQLLQALRGMADDVEEVGHEQIRGEDTTRYRGTLDLSKALDQVPEDRRAALEQQLEGFDTELADVPAEVWVDEDGLARRLRLDFADLATQQVGSATSATLTLELFDYGDDVTVDVPPADETTPIGDVLGGLGGFGGKG